MNKKANTLKNFISRHGLKIGTEKWDIYIQKLKDRPTPINPNNKKFWGPLELIKSYDKKNFICIENIPSEFLEQFGSTWCELRDNNPKFDSIQLYSKTIKALFTAKSQIKKEYWLQRFWTEEEAEIKMTKKRTEQIANEEWYIKKYGEIKGKQLWQDKCDSSNLLLNWTKKFGEAEATIMFVEYKKKLSHSHTLDGYQDRYGEMAEDMWSDWKTQQGRNKDWYIKKYGELDGNNKWNDIILNRKFYSSLEGMIERYGEEEGTKRYNEWYNATLGKSKKQFIDIYGGDIGLEKWNEIDARRTSNWKKSTTLEAFKKRYGEKYGESKWIAWKTFAGNYSQVSFNFFTRIVESDAQFNTATFGLNESIIDVQDLDISKEYIKPDFLWNNKIIEFNGTYWHRDPRFFDNSAENLIIRERDKLREEALERKGYEVFVIWESDFETDPFKSFDLCVEFLLK